MDEYVFKIVKTACVFLMWSCKALYLEMSGPAMIDLKLLFHASYEAVSRAVAGRGAGGFAGAVIGGVLADKCDHWLELILAVSQSLAAIFTFCVPHVSSVDMLWLIYFFLGVLSGIGNITGTRVAIKMWKEKTPVVLPILHMGFGVGAILVTLIANPFLAVIEYDAMPKTKGLKARAAKGLATFHIVKETRVQYLIALISAATFTVSLTFYVYQCLKPKPSKDYALLKTGQSEPETKHLSFKEMINPGTYANGSFWFGSYIFFVLFLYYFHVVGGEKLVAQFIRSFSVDILKFEKDEASYLNMAFWLSFAAGRLGSSILSHFMSISKLFTIQACLNFLAISLIKPYAADSHAMLWTFTIIQGFFVSPLYSSGISYGNTQVDITGICLMVIVFAGSIGDMVYLWVAGKLYDSYGPSAILDGSHLAAFAVLMSVFLFRIAERSKTDLASKSSFFHCGRFLRYVLRLGR